MFANFVFNIYNINMKKVFLTLIFALITVIGTTVGSIFLTNVHDSKIAGGGTSQPSGDLIVNNGDVWIGTGSNFYTLDKKYKYENLITINVWAYKDNWASYNDTRILSCTEDGGWNVCEGNTISFAIYDSGVGYKSFASSISWGSLSSGWHMFTMTFDGSYARGYLDGELICTSEIFSSGKIGYNSSNTIFVGAEAGGNITTPDGLYFVGKIKNIQILNVTYSATQITTLFKDSFSQVVTVQYGVNSDFVLLSVENDYSGYGFKLNSNGYWESTNKGINNSYAIAKVEFETKKSNMTVTFDVINYAESNYDFGIFSNLDTTLVESNTVDTSCKISFKGNSSSAVKNVSYTVAVAGKHCIYVKYRKDSSTHSYNDSLQFKINNVKQFKIEDKTGKYGKNIGFTNFDEGYLTEFYALPNYFNTTDFIEFYRTKEVEGNKPTYNPDEQAIEFAGNSGGRTVDSNYVPYKFLPNLSRGEYKISYEAKGTRTDTATITGIMPSRRDSGEYAELYDNLLVNSNKWKYYEATFIVGSDFTGLQIVFARTDIAYFRNIHLEKTDLSDAYQVNENSIVNHLSNHTIFAVVSSPISYNVSFDYNYEGAPKVNLFNPSMITSTTDANVSTNTENVIVSSVIGVDVSKFNTFQIKIGSDVSYKNLSSSSTIEDFYKEIDINGKESITMGYFGTSFSVVGGGNIYSTIMFSTEGLKAGKYRIGATYKYSTSYASVSFYNIYIIPVDDIDINSNTAFSRNINYNSTYSDFNLNGPYSEDLPTPSRVGYIFDGWRRKFNRLNMDSFMNHINAQKPGAVRKLADGSYEWSASEAYGDGKSILYNPGTLVTGGRYRVSYTSKNTSSEHNQTTAIQPQTTNNGWIDYDGDPYAHSSDWENVSYEFVCPSDFGGFVLVYFVGDWAPFKNIRVERMDVDDYESTSITSTSTMNVSSDHILYAKWSQTRYTLTANPNGGSFSSTSGWTVSGNNLTKSLTYNSAFGTLPTPTRDNYTFNGWYTHPTVGNQVTSSSTMEARDTTIYARWSPKIASINFKVLTKNKDEQNYVMSTLGGSLGNVVYFCDEENVLTEKTVFNPENIRAVINNKIDITLTVNQDFNFFGISFTEGEPTLFNDVKTAGGVANLSYTPTAVGETTIYLYFANVSQNKLKYDVDERYFYFEDGEYPQSYVGDEKNLTLSENITISTTPLYEFKLATKEENIVVPVFEFEGEKFARLKKDNSYKFFAVEPIRWRVSEYGVEPL